MPKITVHGGPSNAGSEVEAVQEDLVNVVYQGAVCQVLRSAIRRPGFQKGTETTDQVDPDTDTEEDEQDTEEGSEEAEVDDIELPAYDEWTKQALIDEVNARNERRRENSEDLLRTTGNKADLVQELLYDDEAQEG